MTRQKPWPLSSCSNGLQRGREDVDHGGGRAVNGCVSLAVRHGRLWLIGSVGVGVGGGGCGHCG